jgi:hypothetical protein
LLPTIPTPKTWRRRFKLRLRAQRWRMQIGASISRDHC